MDRPPDAHEIAAAVVFHDRYAAQPLDLIDFWRSLSPDDQDVVDYLVRAVVESVARPQPPRPRCPRRCDVSTPEAIAPGRWACYACGTEFAWTPADAATR